MHCMAQVLKTSDIVTVYFLVQHVLAKPVWPKRVCLWLCDAVSHSEIVLSSCPEVTRLAQGLIDKHDTAVLELIC